MNMTFWYAFYSKIVFLRIYFLALCYSLPSLFIVTLRLSTANTVYLWSDYYAPDWKYDGQRSKETKLQQTFPVLRLQTISSPAKVPVTASWLSSMAVTSTAADSVSTLGPVTSCSLRSNMMKLALPSNEFYTQTDASISTDPTDSCSRGKRRRKNN